MGVRFSTNEWWIYNKSITLISRNYMLHSSSFIAISQSQTLFPGSHSQCSLLCIRHIQSSVGRIRNGRSHHRVKSLRQDQSSKSLNTKIIHVQSHCKVIELRPETIVHYSISHSSYLESSGHVTMVEQVSKSCSKLDWPGSQKAEGIRHSHYHYPLADLLRS